HTNTGNYSVNGAYFASAGVNNGPLHALATGVDGPNGVYLYSAGGFPNQSYNATNYWVDVVFNTAGVDTTPPTVVSVTPTSGATGVSLTTAVTATFSETMSSSSINTSTFQLRDGSGALVAASVTPGAGTTATLTPSAALALATTYTATVTTGVQDLAGNPMTTAYSWSFTTTATAPTCPCNIWGPQASPAVVASSDSNAVELGVKFRADQNGTISGVRFYKASTNTGTHTGSLWSSTGTLLATATFTNETASGWQQVNFSTPVAITANTTYVVSYHTNVGNYSITGAYFASTGTDNGLL